MPESNEKSIARSLGEFFGHILHGIKSDPGKRVVRKDVQSEERPAPGGMVVLRRTTVEEIEYRPTDGTPPTPGQGPKGPHGC